MLFKGHSRDTEKYIKLTKKKVAEIDHLKGDYELAHEFRDDLFLQVLEVISEGWCADPQRLAKEALKANNIDFPRYYE